MEGCMIIVIEWLARLVLLMLVGLSIWSVSIMIERKRFFSTLCLLYTSDAADE